MNAIKNDAEYRRALIEIDAYFDDEPSLGSREGDRFQELIAQIVEYERVVHPMPSTMADYVAEGDGSRERLERTRVAESRRDNVSDDSVR